MDTANPRPLKQKPAAQAPLSEETLRLTVDRIVVSGLELAPHEAQRFEALLVTELKHRLAEQFAVLDTGIQSEVLRSDWDAIVLELDHPAGLSEVAQEIARRLALALQTAAQKGATG
jgi:hypothetical protein